MLTGEKASALGCPISNEPDGPKESRVSDFGRGAVGWPPAIGAEVPEMIFEATLAVSIRRGLAAQAFPMRGG